MTDFSSLEPWDDKEVPFVVKTIAESDLFPSIVYQFNPESDVEELRKQFVQIKTKDEFQRKILLPTILYIIKQTTDGCTISGLEKLDRNKSYLFVANHRDIVLDATFLGYHLLRHHFKVPAISFGNNLIFNPFVQAVTRLNRMFPVLRGGTRREFYESSMLMSNYIRHVLTDEQRSVWIAQRNGRTKDGDDRTEPGLLKMISMAYEGDFVQKMQGTTIVPVCTSYEYEPCADSKAREMGQRNQGIAVKKRSNEDMLHVWHGITQQKGHVHISICDPITPQEIQQCNDDPLSFCTPEEREKMQKTDLNAPYNALAHLIDNRIWHNYRITGMNRLAYEIVTGKASPDIIYSAKMLFRSDMMLQIYAQPVINQLSLGIDPYATNK